jgi:hypothetical protein
MDHKDQHWLAKLLVAHILKYDLEDKAQCLTLIEPARTTCFNNSHEFKASSIRKQREWSMESWMQSARECQATELEEEAGTE